MSSFLSTEKEIQRSICQATTRTAVLERAFKRWKGTGGMAQVVERLLTSVKP
jgi:hypothetical protein